MKVYGKDVEELKEVFKRVEPLCPYPALFIREISAVAIADLHLGYEGIMAEYYGMFLPKVQFNEEISMLEGIVKRCEAEKIILNGDVKHEFSTTSYHEFKELYDLFSFLQEHFEKVIVVKGNHDNFIARVTSKFERVELVECYKEKDFIFFHGHRSVDYSKSSVIVTAHEHPSIAIYTEVGSKEKIPCFLACRKGDKIFIVQQAFSTLSQGSEVNMLPSSELMNIVFKDVNIDDFIAFTCDECDVVSFGRIRGLRY